MDRRAEAPTAIAAASQPSGRSCPPAFSTSSPSLKHVLFGILLAIVIVVAGLVYAVSRAGYWLEAPAQAPVHADAIVVLGGNDGDRALRALALPRGLRAENRADRPRAGGDPPPANLTWRAEFLGARGVPRSALRFEIYSENSYEEAENILAYAQAGMENGARGQRSAAHAPSCLDVAPRVHGVGCQLQARRIVRAVVHCRRLVARRAFGRIRHHRIHQARVLRRKAVSRLR